VIEQLDTNVANIARYINSGPDGNVGLHWQVATFHAWRDIAKGEELLCTYPLAGVAPPDDA
jgi:SET domain-containing protein